MLQKTATRFWSIKKETLEQHSCFKESGLEKMFFSFKLQKLKDNWVQKKVILNIAEHKLEFVMA